MRTRRTVILAVLALFLGQRLVAGGEHLHQHEAETESDVPTLCHTCTESCPSGEGHHHHEPRPDDHDDGLCPTCVQMFVAVPAADAALHIPDRAPVVRSIVPEGAIHFALPTVHSCRAPPTDPL